MMMMMMMRWHDGWKNKQRCKITPAVIIVLTKIREGTVVILGHMLGFSDVILRRVEFSETC